MKGTNLRQSLVVASSTAPIGSADVVLRQPFGGLSIESLQKGFTGRGRAGAPAREARTTAEVCAWRSSVQRDLSDVQQRMSQLKMLTLQIPSRLFYLEAHRRKPNAVFLRWRRINGMHLTWETLQPLLDALPVPMKSWYAEAHRSMLLLNHQELVLRHALRFVEELVASLESLEQSIQTFTATGATKSGA